MISPSFLFTRTELSSVESRARLDAILKIVKPALLCCQAQTTANGQEGGKNSCVVLKNAYSFYALIYLPNMKIIKIKGATKYFSFHIFQKPNLAATTVAGKKIFQKTKYSKRDTFQAEIKVEVVKPIIAL